MPPRFEGTPLLWSFPEETSNSSTGHRHLWPLAARSSIADGRCPADRGPCDKTDDRTRDSPRHSGEAPDNTQNDRPRRPLRPLIEGRTIILRTGAGRAARTRGPQTNRGDGNSGARGVADGAQHNSKVCEEAARKRCVAVHQSDELLVVVHVVARGEQCRRRARVLGEVPRQGRKHSRCRPGKGRKGRSVKLCTAEPNQVGAVPIRRGPQHRPARVEVLRDGRPVDLVQPRAVASHGNHAVVPLRKRVGEGIGETLSKGSAALPGVVDLEDRKPALSRGLQRVLVEGCRDLPILRVVLPYELLVLPLALRAVAEEQDGRVGVGRVDSPSSRENERECRSGVGVW